MLPKALSGQQQVEYIICRCLRSKSHGKVPVTHDESLLTYETIQLSNDFTPCRCFSEG